MDEKSRLFNDLNEKLDRLRWTLKHPKLFIAEHFASIRNQIDLETEQFIQELDDDDFTGSTSVSGTANSIRMRFIEFLDKNEANLYVKLNESSASSTITESFSVLEKRVKEFFSSIEFTDLIEMEEAYLQLALDIIDATNEIERRLLDNQTFAYVNWKDQDSIFKIGNLVYLREEDYLDRHEISCLSNTEDTDSTLFTHESLQASLNASLSVGISRPFVLTRKVLIASKIARFLNSIESSTGKILFIYFENSSTTKFDISSEDAEFYQELIMYSEEILSNLSRKSIDAAQIIEMDFGSNRFMCNMSHNKLKRFEIADSFVKSFDSLDLSENQLETLDVEQLAKASQLRCLNLVNAFLPDTKFSLDFLSSLTELTELNLTLPNAPIDFDVFKYLKNVGILRLHSANSLDSNVERPRLTNKHFKQISVMKELTTLELFNFKIESLQKEMLEEFAQLTNLSLIDNEIVHVEEDAFDQCIINKSFQYSFFRLANNSIRSIRAGMFRGLSQNDELNLNCNRIEQLPSGVFDDLASMRLLCLNNNSIRHINRGVFNALTGAVYLQNNLVESIEADSFLVENFAGFFQLFLSNCKLKSIDNTMFRGQDRMIRLDLSYNQIEAFEVVTENCRSSIKGIMSPVEYELVKRTLFVEMNILRELNLKGNKLEKLDLNCFCNLSRLRDLDVSSNQICELNEEIRPGVLSSLKFLDLSDNQLTRVSRRSFGESIDIRALKLSKNRIERLDEDFFDAFDQLTKFQIQNNNLSMKITAQMFARCGKLEYLNLMGNPDVSVEIGAFSGLESLKQIHLEIRKADSSDIERLIEDMNHLSTTELHLSLINSSIESLDAFKLGNKIWNIQILDLSQNRIKSINSESFSCFDRLFDLDLSSNQIETLDDPTIFESLSELRKLSLRGNNLNRIHRRIFKCLSKLNFLDLSHNPALTNIDAGIFRGLFCLETLNLAGNNIAFFDLNVLLRSCQQLECLDLSNNQLDNKSINEESMSGSTAQNLKQLKLSNNRLEKMDFVRNLYRLEKLDLSGNKIESVQSPLGVNLLGRLVKLRHVNLSGNEIKSLDVKAIFSHLKYQLKFLDLSNNLFNANKSDQASSNCYLFIEES